MTLIDEAVSTCQASAPSLWRPSEGRRSAVCNPRQTGGAIPLRAATPLKSSLSDPLGLGGGIKR